MKILIVDDEALARARLQDLISEELPECELLEAGNGQDALESIQAWQPDLVLLDIRMPIMDGLEVAQHLLNIDNAPALVFTTAYQDHALTAFDSNAVDYLVKPIRKERLLKALAKANRLRLPQIQAIRASEPEMKQRKHLSASRQGKIHLQPIEEVYYLKAEQKYVIANWPEGDLLLDESLKSLETEFSDRFIRIHRNTLVATNYISGLEKDNAGNTLIVMRDMPERLPVSRRHLAGIKKVLK